MQLAEFFVDVGTTNYWCRLVRISDELATFHLFDGDRAETNVGILTEAVPAVSLELQKLKAAENPETA